mmetsp:Transcript_38221/g.76482  ORF Transcript_38221/g.76482 Transcript_38221/m.76482 type:complete len:250 (+) Transcript_38221:148-897(+)
MVPEQGADRAGDRADGNVAQHRQLAGESVDRGWPGVGRVGDDAVVRGPLVCSQLCRGCWLLCVRARCGGDGSCVIRPHRHQEQIQAARPGGSTRAVCAVLAVLPAALCGVQRRAPLRRRVHRLHQAKVGHQVDQRRMALLPQLLPPHPTLPFRRLPPRRVLPPRPHRRCRLRPDDGWALHPRFPALEPCRRPARALCRRERAAHHPPGERAAGGAAWGVRGGVWCVRRRRELRQGGRQPARGLLQGQDA